MTTSTVLSTQRIICNTINYYDYYYLICNNVIILGARYYTALTGSFYVTFCLTILKYYVCLAGIMQKAGFGNRECQVKIIYYLYLYIFFFQNQCMVHVALSVLKYFEPTECSI